MASIIYVGTFTFPEGDAAAARVLGIGKALRDAGYTVSYIGIEVNGRPEDLLPDGRYVYQNFSYSPVTTVDLAAPRSWRRLWQTHITGNTIIQRLNNMPHRDTLAIIAYHASSCLLLRLMRWCRKRQIALIVDCTEWEDPKRILAGPLGPFRWDNELRMRWLHRKIGRLLVISQWLARYYQQRGCQVLHIPPLVDRGDAKWQVAARPSVPDTGALRLVFSGSPHRERLALILRGCLIVRQRGHQIVLEFTGCSKPLITRLLGSQKNLIDDLGASLIFHGKLPVPLVMETISRADYGILFRYRERSTEACFPMKIAEFLTLGLPIICNNTTDIGRYIEDGKSGLIIKDDTVEAFVNVLEDALSLSKEQHEQMRIYAKEAAAACFDYHAYIAPLRQFIDQHSAASHPKRVS